MSEPTDPKEAPADGGTVDVVPWYMLKTVWAQIIGLVAGALTLLGVHVLEDPNVQVGLVALLSAAATIYWRVTSTSTARVKK
jgi:hypothetical protein